LGQVPKQWWSVPVACLILPSVCCHCGVVVVVKYILYTFLDHCLCFTWTTLIFTNSTSEHNGQMSQLQAWFSLSHSVSLQLRIGWPSHQHPQFISGDSFCCHFAVPTESITCCIRVMQGPSILLFSLKTTSTCKTNSLLSKLIT
jgi:hypothetical protein